MATNKRNYQNTPLLLGFFGLACFASGALLTVNQVLEGFYLMLLAVAAAFAGTVNGLIRFKRTNSGKVIIGTVFSGFEFCLLITS